jgi:stress response protein YsnF
LLKETDSLFLTRTQETALRRADSVFSERVRGVYRPLGEYLARGNGAAGKAEMDSAETVRKAYWRIFWEQPEIADSIVTPTQKELFPLLRHMLNTSKKDRENSQVQFGYPITMSAAPKPPAQGSGAPAPPPRASP